MTCPVVVLSVDLPDPVSPAPLRRRASYFVFQLFQDGRHLRGEAHRVLDRDLEGDSGARLLVEAAGIANALQDVARPRFDHQEQDDVAPGGQIQAEEGLLRLQSPLRARW